MHKIDINKQHTHIKYINSSIWLLGLFIIPVIQGQGMWFYYSYI